MNIQEEVSSPSDLLDLFFYKKKPKTSAVITHVMLTALKEMKRITKSNSNLLIMCCCSTIGSWSLEYFVFLFFCGKGPASGEIFARYEEMTRDRNQSYTATDPTGVLNFLRLDEWTWALVMICQNSFPSHKGHILSLDDREFVWVLQVPQQCFPNCINVHVG